MSRQGARRKNERKTALSSPRQVLLEELSERLNTRLTRGREATAASA